MPSHWGDSKHSGCITALHLAGSVLVPILTVGTQPPALVSIEQWRWMFYNNAVCSWARGALRACLENLYKASFEDENPRK